MRRSSLVAIAISAVAALLHVSCNEEPVADTATGSNVIWIIGDGLRYDAGVAMDSFRKLSKQATVYDVANVAASDCVPSIASMFTGLLPSEHEAHVVRLRRNARWNYHEQALKPQLETIAETFQRLGYETALATANFRISDTSTGLAQGFDELLLSKGAATTMNARIETWLTTRPDGPFFLVIDYADTRHGYSPAPGNPEPEPDSLGDSHRIVEGLEPAVLSGEEYSVSELELLKSRYAEGVASLDFGINELFRSLRTRGLYDEALIVLTADHGHSLGEHNLLRSGRGGYEELLHVPLAIKSPKQALPARTRDRFSMVRLPRKILSEAFPEALVELETAFALHEDDTDVTAEQWYSHPYDFGHRWSDRFDQVLRIHYRNRWKFIDSDEGTDQLYDLGADKRELDNQAEKHRGVAADMEMRIKRVFGEI